MKLYDISSLRIDTKYQGDIYIYDLVEPTFVLRELPKYEYKVKKEEEMRIDLVSFSIYNTVDYADFILNLNDIDNPLNIKEGDTLYYLPIGELDTFKISPKSDTENRKALLSPNKSNLKDSNRQKFIEDNYQLPPSFTETTQSPITVGNGRITISPIE